MNVDGIKASINNVQEVFEVLEKVSKEYDITINPKHSSTTTFKFEAKTGNLLISTESVELSFNKSETATLKVYNDIKNRIDKCYTYSIPTKGLVFYFGEMEETWVDDYDYDDEYTPYRDDVFNSILSYIPQDYYYKDSDVLPHCKGLLEKKFLPYDVTFLYNHRNKTLDINTPKDYYYKEKDITKLRKKYSIINDLYVIFYREFFGCLPIDIVNEEESYDDSVAALKADYKLLKEYIKNQGENSVLLEDPSIHFVFHKRNKDMSGTGLYLYQKGFNIRNDQNTYNYSFNVFSTITELEHYGNMFHPNFEKDAAFTKYLKNKKLTNFEKKNTPEFFEYLTEKFIFDNLSKKPHSDLGGNNFNVDITLNLGYVASAKQVTKSKYSSSNILLFNSDGENIGNIYGQFSKNFNEEVIINSVNELIKLIVE